MNVFDFWTFLNQKFEGKKTYTAAVVTILSAALAYFAGELTLFQSLQLALPALFGATVRHGVKLETEKAATVSIVAAEIASGQEIKGLTE